MKRVGPTKIHETRAQKRRRIDLSQFFPLLELPRELLHSIFSFLKFSDIARISRLNKELNSTANDNTFWRAQVIQHGMPLDFCKNEALSWKEKLRIFLVEPEVRAKYPPLLVEAIGIRRMVTMPKLDLGDNRGDTGYLDFIRTENLKSYESMRGIDAFGRPFISLCIRNNKTGRDQVTTIFKRYTDASYFLGVGFSAAGENSLVPPYSGPLNDSSYEFIGRLYRHEPCGEISKVTYNEDETKLTPEGKSVLELTDQKSRITFARL